MRSLWAAPLLLLLLAGCVRTEATLADVTIARAPICPNGVKIYADTAAIEGPWEVVAFLSSTGTSEHTSVAGMLNSQRKKAAQVGANGVIPGAITEANGFAQVVAALNESSTERRGRALAIRVPGDTARVANACDGPRNRADAKSQGSPHSATHHD